MSISSGPLRSRRKWVLPRLEETLPLFHNFPFYLTPPLEKSRLEKGRNHYSRLPREPLWELKCHLPRAHIIEEKNESWINSHPALPGVFITGSTTCSNLSPKQERGRGAGSPAISNGLCTRHRAGASDNPPAYSFTSLGEWTPDLPKKARHQGVQ